MPVPSLQPESPEENKDYHPQKWTARHRMIVGLHLAGYRNKEIAKSLGMSEGRVSVILSDSRATQEVKRMSERVADNITDVHTRLLLYSNEALTEIVDEMRSCEDPAIRQRAAFGIMDRAGYTPSAKETEPAMQIPQDIAARMEDALADSEDFEEVEYEEILVGSADDEMAEEEEGDDEF
jgi:predicted transcriptional regulator